MYPDKEICRHIYENTDDAVLLAVSDDKIIAANPSACRMFGKSELEICSEGFHALIGSAQSSPQAEGSKNPDIGNESAARLIRGHGAPFFGLVRTTEFHLLDGSKRTAIFIRDVTKQAEAEALLHNLDQRYKQTLDNMIEGCQIVDHAWRYLYLNDAAVRHSQKTRDELLGHTMMEVYPGIEDTQMFAALRGCMEQKSAMLLENVFIFPNGESGVFELSIQPALEGLFILSVDITQRKITQQRLQRSEENLRMFIEHAPASIAMFDRNMVYLSVSRRFYTDYGITDPNVIGRSHYDVFPELPERLKAIHRRCLKGKPEKSEAEPFIRADGKVDWVRWEVRPWYTAKGVIGGILLFSEVVTAHKEAEAALRASEERWKFALEGAGDGIFDWDCQTNTVFFSPQWKAMLGYQDGEIGNTIEEVFRRIHPDDKGTVTEILRKLSSGETSRHSTQIRLLCKDGRYKWILSRGLVLSRDKSGKPLRIIATHTDIDTLIKVQESLFISNRANRLLSSCNGHLVRCVSEPELLSDICESIVEIGNYAFAWACLQNKGKTCLSPVAQWGDRSDFLGKLLCTDSGRIHCPVMKALQMGKPYLVRDFCNNPRPALWMESAKQLGYESFIALPLDCGGNNLGSLNIFSCEPGAFIAEEIKILEELANDLAYGLTSLRLQKKYKRTLQKLTASEKKYRTLFESASEAIIMVDIKTRKIDYANPAACKMLGYGMEELSMLSIADIHAQSDMQYVLSEFEAQLHGIKTLSSAIPFMRKDETTVYADVNATKMTIEGKQVLVGFATDITQRLLAEKEREAAEHKLLNAMKKAVELVAKTVELRDPYTAGHQERVTALAGKIAIRMGLSDHDAEGIRMAAVVHDVGKICIPSEILNKPGKINAMEYALIKAHAQAGYDILKDVEFPWPIADIILQHHERMDGSGYPNGLTGPDIVLGARIIAVADVVEAMASHRPYRPALGIEQALKEISDNTGKLYDTQVAGECMRLFEESLQL
ncbi:MAG: PAS domain S-box protein [Bacillota bacterium]